MSFPRGTNVSIQPKGGRVGVGVKKRMRVTNMEKHVICVCGCFLPLLLVCFFSFNHFVDVCLLRICSLLFI